MKKKIAITALLIVCFAVQSVFACFITGVGRLATADGSTMTSHTCDSASDDLRLWLIPSMAEGTEREVVVDGRKDADFTNFGGLIISSRRYRRNFTPNSFLMNFFLLPRYFFFSI